MDRLVQATLQAGSSSLDDPDPCGDVDHGRGTRLLGVYGLRYVIPEYLPKADREGFDLPIFNSIAASISNNRKAKPAVRSGIGFPTKKKRKKRENGEPSSEGRPPVFGRLAEARISARTEPVKEGWRIWVRIVPTEDTQPKDLTYLSFGIDEDSDTGVAGNWLTPVDVFVDGKPGETKDRIISLGKLARSAPVTVEAVLARPANSVDGVTVAVRPLLSLKRVGRSEAGDSDRKAEETG